MAWRWVNRAASLILGLVVLATLGGGYLFYRAMPAYSGTETLPGLSAEVRVWRDAFRRAAHLRRRRWTTRRGRSATPHASERMFQMDIMRRVGQGRIGRNPRRRSPGVDKFIRTVGFYREAEASYSALSPVGAKAPPGLCRRRQRLPRQPWRRAPARVPPRRRSSGTLETGRLAGHRQARFLSAIAELRARSVARPSPPEARRGQVELALSRPPNPADPITTAAGARRQARRPTITSTMSSAR